MAPQLSVTPKPFVSSRLAIPPSPFSPKLPITPPESPPKSSVTASERMKTKLMADLPLPPQEPLNWLWQCHVCNRVYQLGVTRRCLEDGHYFCAGTTTVKHNRRTGYKKTIRHKACASEFDYQGWKAWGTWRRSIADQLAAAEALESLLNSDEPAPLFGPVVPDEGRWLSGMWAKKPTAQKPTQDFWGKDCWHACDYPSECRWGKQYGVQTPVQPAVTVPSSPSRETSSVEQHAKTTFEDILIDVSDALADGEGNEHVEVARPASVADRKPSMDDLLESVKRRKRRSTGQVPSPLASNPPSPVKAEFSGQATAQVLQRAFDDFDLDIRKSFEPAGEVLNEMLSSARPSTSPVVDKTDAVSVKGSKAAGGKKRLTSGLLRGSWDS